MMISRRNLLKILGTGAGAAAVMNLIEGPFWSVQTLKAASLSAGDFKELADVAFAHAWRLGCSYTGFRIDCCRNASVSAPVMPDRPAGAASAEASHVPVVIESGSFRFSVFVAYSGAWGFAESTDVSAGNAARKDEVARLTARAVADAQANAALAQRQAAVPPTAQNGWVAPRPKDASHMARRHRRAFREAVSEAVGEQSGARDAGSAVTIRGEETYFASTRDDCMHLTHLVRVGA